MLLCSQNNFDVENLLFLTLFHKITGNYAYIATINYLIVQIYKIL